MRRTRGRAGKRRTKGRRKGRRTSSVNRYKNRVGYRK